MVDVDDGEEDTAGKPPYTNGGRGRVDVDDGEENTAGKPPYTNGGKGMVFDVDDGGGEVI